MLCAIFAHVVSMASWRCALLLRLPWVPSAHTLHCSRQPKLYVWNNTVGGFFHTGIPKLVGNSPQVNKFPLIVF